MKMRSGSEDEDYEQPSMVCGLFIHLYGNRDHGTCHSVYFEPIDWLQGGFPV